MCPIYHLSIASTGRDKNLFISLRNKKTRYIGHLGFLLACKKHRVIPKFIKVSCNLSSTHRLRSTIQRLHRIVLRTVIKDTRSKLAKIESQLYRLHLKLSNDLPLQEWRSIDTTSTAFSAYVSKKQRHTHNKKLLKLRTPSTSDSNADTNPVSSNEKVINLSKTTISDTQKKTLQLGLNFSVSTPCDNITTLSNVENSFKNSKLSSGQKDYLRAKISNILVANQRYTPNLNSEERTSLKELKSNSSIVITQSDKGGVITILDKSQYDSGINDILSDSNTYENMSAKSTTRDPIKTCLNTLKAVIKISPILSDVQRRALVPSYFRPGYMYILPKIHKPVLSFRPIISSINTPIYPLSKFLARRLAPLAKFNTYSLTNSFEFVDSIRSLPPTDGTMVSFDIVSLFSNVPIVGSIMSLKRRLLEVNTPLLEAEAILKLVDVCTSNTYFTSNQVLYRQKSGLPMGGNLSPILCDIYMHYLEKDILDDTKCPISWWRRYVDDIFSIFINSIHFTITSYLQHLNTLDPFIKFTIEVERESSIPFLDVLIKRTPSGFNTTVYRKPFAVQVPPHSRSAHIYSQKVTAFYTYVRRALHYCHDQATLNDELHYIRAIATDRGFNPTIIDQAVAKFTKFKPVTFLTKDVSLKNNFIVLPNHGSCSTKLANVLRSDFRIVFKPVKKLCHMFGPPKDVMPDVERWGVYFIPCSCAVGYIGQTRRALKTRVNEHKQCVRKCDTKKSNIAKHSRDENHNFVFNDTKIIKFTSHPCKLDFIEAFLITKFSSSLVNDSHFPFISHIWRDVIRKTRFSLRRPAGPQVSVVA